jgi:hypothetical protein
MPPKLLLPPLRAEASLPNVAGPGEWTGADISLLENLSQGLKRARLTAPSAGIVSIPDVWAQPEVFRAALTNPRSALHERCRSEWRGLLALFALAQSNHLYQVGVVQIDLAQQEGLLPMLGLLPPTATLNASGPWRHIGLITVGGECVGMLVPSTLVCSSRTPIPPLTPRVPWIVEGRFTDPTADTHILSDDDLRVLIRFCNGLRESYQPARLGRHDRTLLSVLVRELQGFHDAAAAALSARGQSMDSTVLTPITLRLPMPELLYDPLQHTTQVDSGDDYEYQSALRFRSDIQLPYQGMVLYDPRLAAQWSERPSMIRFWRGVSLERMENAALREKTFQKITRAGFVSVPWELLFTAKLCRVQSSADPRIRITTHGDELKGFLLPLTPLVLLFLRPDELLGRLTVIEQAGGTYVANLTVNLHASDHEEARSYSIERIYTEKDVVNAEIPAGLSLWPNFHSPQWPHYFVFYSGLLEHNFAVRTLLSPESLAAFVKSNTDEAGQLAAKIAHHAGLYGEDELRILSSSDQLVELYRDESAPEAVYCDRVLDKEKRGRFASREERTPVGLLLMPRRTSSVPRRPTPPWTIGVDLGTTKTTVYCASADEQAAPSPLVFANRIVSPITVSDASRNVHRDFIPQAATSVPFMTALRLGPREAWAAPSPMWSCFVYYIDNIQSVVRDLTASDLRALKIDLKWSMTQLEGTPHTYRTLIQLYLQQIVLQAAAEAFDRQVDLDQIRWRFSYPEAFQRDQLLNFKRATEAAVEQAFPRGRNVAQRIDTFAESRATAHFFRDTLPLDTAEPLVTLDIGGQTTDITIWRDEKVVWRGSLQLAGRHLLIEHLVARPSILKDILAVTRLPPRSKPSYERVLPELIEVKSTQIRMFGIEMLMGNTELGARFLKDLYQISDLPQLKTLERVAILGLAALLYYVGLLMRDTGPARAARATKPTQRGARPVPATQVSVCVGGRVSSLFEYLFPEGPRKEQLLHFFEAAGVGATSSPNFYFSTLPKHEVAYGLVTLDANDESSKEGRQRTALLGEQVVLDGQIREAHEELGKLRDKLTPESSWRVNDLPTLRDMLRLVRDHLGIEVGWTASAKNPVIGRINNELAQVLKRLEPPAAEDPNAATTQSESTELEPIYIVAVRELLRAVVSGECTTREIQ